MLALNVSTLLRIRAGTPLLQVTAPQFLAGESERKELRGRVRSTGVGWQALQAGEPPDHRAPGLPRAADRDATRRWAPHCRPAIRPLFIDYLTERSTTVDYATLTGLVRMLVEHF